jgi:hypothetical protein
MDGWMELASNHPIIIISRIISHQPKDSTDLWQPASWRQMSVTATRE